MLGVHFAIPTPPAHDSPSAAPILSTRLRELASSLLELANAHERLALALAADPESTTRFGDEAHLRAELDRMRGNIETLLSSLVEVSDQLRQRGALA